MTRPTDDKWFLGKYTGQLIKTCRDYIATIDNTESNTINKLLDLKATAKNEDEVILADTMIGKTLSKTRQTSATVTDLADTMIGKTLNITRHTSATVTDLVDHRKQLEIVHKDLLKLTKGEKLNNIIEGVGMAKVSKSFVQSLRDIVSKFISSLTNALSKFMEGMRPVSAPDPQLLHKKGHQEVMGELLHKRTNYKPVLKELVENHVLKKVDTSSTDRLQKAIQHPEFKHHTKQFKGVMDNITSAGTDKLDPSIEGKSSNLQSGLRKK